MIIFSFQLVGLVGSDFSCQSCLDSLNTSHHVKEVFLKSQEILIQKGSPDQLLNEVDVLIKEEEPDVKEEPSDFLDEYREQPGLKGLAKKTTKRQTQLSLSKKYGKSFF